MNGRTTPVTLPQWAASVKRVSSGTLDRLTNIWLGKLYGITPLTKHTQFSFNGWMN